MGNSTDQKSLIGHPASTQETTRQTSCARLRVEWNPQGKWKVGLSRKMWQRSINDEFRMWEQCVVRLRLILRPESKVMMADTSLLSGWLYHGRSPNGHRPCCENVSSNWLPDFRCLITVFCRSFIGFSLFSAGSRQLKGRITLLGVLQVGQQLCNYLSPDSEESGVIKKNSDTLQRKCFPFLTKCLMF